MISGLGLYELLKDVENPSGIEIGCDIGDTSEFLLSQLPTLTLYCVDPYSNYIDWNGNNLNEREEKFASINQRLERFKGRVVFIRETSDDALGHFPDHSQDFVFIDGLHTYEQVGKDCVNYLPKVKPGGLFSGHDYSVIPEVGKAVNEFSELKGKTVITTLNDVWYWYAS